MLSSQVGYVRAVCTLNSLHTQLQACNGIIKDRRQQNKRILKVLEEDNLSGLTSRDRNTHKKRNNN